MRCPSVPCCADRSGLFCRLAADLGMRTSTRPVSATPAWSSLRHAAGDTAHMCLLIYIGARRPWRVACLVVNQMDRIPLASRRGCLCGRPSSDKAQSDRSRLHTPEIRMCVRTKQTSNLAYLHTRHNNPQIPPPSRQCYILLFNTFRPSHRHSSVRALLLLSRLWSREPS